MYPHLGWLCHSHHYCWGPPLHLHAPHTDNEWDNLPHVILTSDLGWDPTIHDHTLDDDEHWYDAMCDMDEPPYDSPFDSEGNYHGCVIAQSSTLPCPTLPP
jgi:hypothetical protein